MVIFLKTSNAYNLERIPIFLASIALQIILRNRFTFCFKDGKTVKHNGAKNLEEMAPKQFCETSHQYLQKSFRKTLENVCSEQKIKKKERKIVLWPYTADVWLSPLTPDEMARVGVAKLHCVPVYVYSIQAARLTYKL